jgi:glucan phosphoethanolaminetransferase (alkaline phosphatase superfamily)
MTAFPTYSGLDTALIFALSLFSILVLSASAIVVAFIWSRCAPSCRRGPRLLLRLALVSSLILFVLALLMCVYALFKGFCRDSIDFFSMAFWPATSGAITFLALRQLRHYKSTTNSRSA